MASYQVWRSERPDFTPGDSDATPFKAQAAQSGAMTWCDDPQAAPLTPYFYRVRSLGADAETLGYSRTTGYFAYRLQ